MENNIQFIREVCIKDNHEILALTPGCRVLWTNPTNEETKRKAKQWKCTVIRNWGNGAISIIDDFHVNTIQATTTVFKNDFDAILGRPIRLADVLYSIKRKEVEQEKEIQRKVSDLGGAPGVKYPLFYHAMMAITKYELDGGGFWNLLKDDLTLQSPEMVEFISNLLKS